MSSRSASTATRQAPTRRAARKAASPRGARGPALTYKLFVFDLDETLWTVSEGLSSLVRPPFHLKTPDRVENDQGHWVEIKPGVRDLFQFIKARKSYISLANRNDPGPTLDLLEALKITPFLDFPQFGWRPKEESIKRTIKEIQKRDKVVIKPEEVFFLDDWMENVVAVKNWGATALLYGQDIETYEELLKMLKGS
jgi:magnesium-dependent phosphatase-1